MNIVVIPGTNYNNAPTGFDAAVKYVTNLYDSLFSANVTVYINVDYGIIDSTNQTVPPLGRSNWNLNQFSYSTVRQALINMGAPGSNTLPTTSPFPNATLWLTTAQQKALGLLSANFQPGNGYPYPGVDGYVGVASNQTLTAQLGDTWSFSPTATPAANQFYIVGSLEHEFSEVLGRSSFDGTNAINNAPSYSIMDLFRYSATNVRQFNANGTAYFSINNGTTILDYLNNTSIDANGDLGDWAASGPGKVTGSDAYLNISFPGLINGLTPTDMTLMNAIGWREASVTPPPPPPPVPNTRDIFWHDASGANQVWALNQSEQIIGGPNLPTTPTSWKIAGVGDFNNDGVSDLFWHDASGANQIWNLDITDSQSGGAPLPTVPTSWTVEGVGNFHGAGPTDILWHNANGQNLIWNIQNDQFNPATDIAALPTTPTSWTVAGIGYFNGNASSDVLWHNTVSGQNLIWDIQNDQFNPATNIAVLPTTSASWTVAGIGAFGGNGASDILWHNTISGQNLIWVIQNNQYAGGAILPTTPTSWSVAGVGDFTGSGTDGILWHDASGATQIWNMQNFQLVSGANLPAPPPSWNVSGVGVNTISSGLATGHDGDPAVSQMVQAMASFAPSGGTGAVGSIAQQPSDLNAQLFASNPLH